MRMLVLRCTSHFVSKQLEKGVKGVMGDIKINMSMPSMFVFSINIVEDC